MLFTTKKLKETTSGGTSTGKHVFLCAVEFNFAYSVVLICRSTGHTGHVSSNKQ